MRLRKLMAAAVLVAAAAAAYATEFVKGPYLQELTPTKVTVMWETDEAAEGVLEYGLSGALGRRLRFRGRGQPARVELRDLKPDTKYYYRVTEGDASTATYSFRTMPEEGTFTFAAYSDNRSTPRDHAKVIAGIAGKHPSFVLHAGDMVGEGSDASQWEPQFFDPAGPLLARTAMFTVPGNHEEESPNYYNYLGSHRTEAWYSFDCVNAHFTMLNSCLDLSPGSEQYEWLEKDLASTDKRWRFVVLHHPLYSSGAHGSAVGRRESIEPLLRRYAVDIVFSGHDHNYERTHPIVSAFGNVRPVTYIVTGGGGAPRRAVRGDFFTAVKLRDLNFCTVTLDGNTLDFTAYDGNGREFDSLRIVKIGEGYANTYPSGGVPFELAALEGSVEKALSLPGLEYPSSDRSETVHFEIPAPDWGDLEVELIWRQREGRVVVSPTSFKVAIAKGASATVAFDLAIEKDVTALGDLEVRGRTSIGEFSLVTSPLSFKKKPESR